MLYKVRNGPCENTLYGIALGKVLNLPANVLTVAQEVSEQLASDVGRRREEKGSRIALVQARMRKLVFALVEQLKQARYSTLRGMELRVWLKQLQDEFVMRATQCEEDLETAAAIEDDNIKHQSQYTQYDQLYASMLTTAGYLEEWIEATRRTSGSQQESGSVENPIDLETHAHKNTSTLIEVSTEVHLDSRNDSAMEIKASRLLDTDPFDMTGVDPALLEKSTSKMAASRLPYQSISQRRVIPRPQAIPRKRSLSPDSDYIIVSKRRSFDDSAQRPTSPAIANPRPVTTPPHLTIHRPGQQSTSPSIASHQSKRPRMDDFLPTVNEFTRAGTIYDTTQDGRHPVFYEDWCVYTASRSPPINHQASLFRDFVTRNPIAHPALFMTGAIPCDGDEPFYNDYLDDEEDGEVALMDKEHDGFKIVDHITTTPQRELRVVQYDPDIDGYDKWSENTVNSENDWQGLLDVTDDVIDYDVRG